MRNLSGPLCRVAGLIAVVALITGCSLFPSKRSLGVDAADVVKVELYGSRWGDSTGPITKVTIENPTTNPEPGHQLVTMFTMPVTTLGRTPQPPPRAPKPSASASP